MVNRLHLRPSSRHRERSVKGEISARPLAPAGQAHRGPSPTPATGDLVSPERWSASYTSTPHPPATGDLVSPGRWSTSYTSAQVLILSPSSQLPASSLPPAPPTSTADRPFQRAPRSRGDRIRTCDIWFPKPALYQAELLPVSGPGGTVCDSSHPNQVANHQKVINLSNNTRSPALQGIRPPPPRL